MHIAPGSWQREEGESLEGGTHSSFSGRGRELHFTPSHTLLSPSLVLSPQGLDKEPVVPSQEPAVTKHRGAQVEGEGGVYLQSLSVCSVLPLLCKVHEDFLHSHTHVHMGTRMWVASCGTNTGHLYNLSSAVYFFYAFPHTFLCIFSSCQP